MACAGPTCVAGFEEGELVIRRGKSKNTYYPPPQMAFKQTQDEGMVPGVVTLKSSYDDMLKKPDASPDLEENMIRDVARVTCPSGAKCCITDEAHRYRFAHRGDWDYAPPSLMSGGRRRTDDTVITHKADRHIFGKRAIWAAYHDELADIPAADSPVRIPRRSHDGVSDFGIRPKRSSRAECNPCGFLMDDDDRPWYF
mmetsp:Transcript_38206/g.91840  ORF Transcript_38206/g.91840 Transcript_38206/m.91840 type:complete len:198 (-) Transcript_38206:544-1137(-)